METSPLRIVLCSADLPKDGPHITGEEEQYQVGEEVSLNCTSGKSYPASELQWFINDEQVIAKARDCPGQSVSFTVSPNVLFLPHAAGLLVTAALVGNTKKGTLYVLKPAVVV